MEQKTLESLLVTIDAATGEQVSISSRCAEMDAEVPLHLGVSKAILENVIFCHQEDANWPLSEPSVLKKKFDEIFASTRYTKALDVIKSIRKEQAIEIKLDEQKLEFLKMEREKSHKIVVSLGIYERKIEENGQKIEFFEGEAKKISSEVNELLLKLSNIESICNEREALENERNLYEREVLELLKNTKEIEGNDDELNELISKYSCSVEESERKMSLLQNEKMLHEKEMTRLSESHSKLVGESASKRSLFEMQQKRMEDNRRILSALLAKYSLSSDAQDLRGCVEEHLLQKEKEFSHLHNNLQIRMDEQIQRVNNVAVEKSKIIESKAMKMKQREEMESEISKLKQKQKQLCMVEKELLLLKDQISKEELYLNDLRSGISGSAFVNSIEEIEKKLREIDEIYRVESGKISEMERNKKNMEVYEKKKMEAEKSKAQKQQLSAEIKFLFMKLINCDSIPMDQWIKTLAAFDEEIKKEFQQKDSQYRSLLMDHSNSSMMMRIEETKIGKLKERQSWIEEKVGSVCSISEFQHLYEESQMKLTNCIQIMSSSSNAVQMYQNFIKASKKDDCCPLCVRKFHANAEQGEFIERLTEIIQLIPSKVSSAKEEKSLLEDRLAKMDSLKALVSEFDRNQADLNGSNLHALKQKVEEMEQALKSQKGTVDELCDKIKRAEECKAKLNEFFALKIEEVEMNFVPFDADEMFNCNSKIEELLSVRKMTERRKIEIVKEFEEMEKQVKKKEEFMADLIEKANCMKLQLMEIEKIQADISNLNSCITQIEEAISNLNQQYDSICKSLSQLNAEKEQIVNEMKLLDEQHSSITADFQMALNQTFFKDENLFNESDIAQLEGQVLSLKQSLQKQAELIKCTEREIVCAGKEKSEIELLKVQINDTFKIRRMRSRLIEINERLSCYSASLLKEKEALKEKISLDRMKESNLWGERSKLWGEKKQLEEEVSKMKLENDFNKVELEYKQQFLKLKTLKIAHLDLEKYSKALDSAIVKFHTLKMEEINKLIKELWSATYQGNDIDTIEIRSEKNSVANEKTEAARSYRVVMLKDSVELDMRGRSSAGQRVLACLIIRLALAESFGVNCGILALDEPTTNLDRDNIISLAESLSNIIKSRRAQNNYQLIVITHDEDFVSLLGRSEYVDYYWKVSKNIE